MGDRKQRTANAVNKSQNAAHPSVTVVSESETPESHPSEEVNEMTPLRYEQLDEAAGINRRGSGSAEEDPEIFGVQGGRILYHRDGLPSGWVAPFFSCFSRMCVFLISWSQSCWHHVRSDVTLLHEFCLTSFYRATCQKEKLANLAKMRDDSSNRIICMNINVTGPAAKPRPSNHVTTAKYSILSFLPLFLFEQFSRYANLFFLMISILQVSLPEYSPTGQFTTAGPLVIILFVTALKELYEDLRRDKADSKVNNSNTVFLKDSLWQHTRWHSLRVGNIVRVTKDQLIPADLILLSSSAQHGIAYIETAQLDGETNLKMRKARPETSMINQSTAKITATHARVECAPPNKHLYDFRGNILLMDTASDQQLIPLSLGPEQLLLRGAVLRNTRWIVGLVAYTGHETKLMLNSASTPLKQSGLEKKTNFQIIFLFALLLILAGICALANTLVRSDQIKQHWYLTGVMTYVPVDIAAGAQLPLTFLTFVILYNNLVPISLLVTLEVVKFVQASFISSDLEMYDKESDTPASARTSNLNEELGQISYIFSDKTGTLTRNVMVFRSCSIAGDEYGDVLENREECERLQKDGVKRPGGPADRFLTALALCHTAVPETNDLNAHPNYMASSPDEAALLNACKAVGYVFMDRTPSSVQLRVNSNQNRHFDLLQVLEFTSARRRMSVIVRDKQNGRLTLLIKGADVAILSLLRPSDDPRIISERAASRQHLDYFASRGLRTLCVAECELNEAEYNTWSIEYAEALATVGSDRADRVADVCNRIERGLQLLGVTAIEDRLQDGVPETIASLLSCNIRVWVLTGDRAETAINIAHACQLFLPAPAPLLTLTAPTDLTMSEADQRDSILEGLRQIESDAKALASYSFVVDGVSLRYVLADENARQRFLQLATEARSVMCCRVSPMQKADVVTLVRKNVHPEPTTLAIGDGANDVSMIRAANVGIGISGVEGLQAVCAADYAIAQFRFLRRLLFVHGTICYRRLSTLVLWCFYKNVTLYAINMWFAYFCGWSGTAIFDRWLIATYNVFFTSLPPAAVGGLDWPATADSLLKYPKRYYWYGQKNQLFNGVVFWTWMADAVLHSGLIFFLTAVGVGGSPFSFSSSGFMSDHISAGNFAFTAVLITVSLRAALTMNHWTWLSAFAIFFGVFIWFIFVLPAYSYLYPVLNFPAMSGQVDMIYPSVSFWLSAVFVVPLAALGIDVFLLMADRLLEHPRSWPSLWRSGPLQNPCAACGPLLLRLFARRRQPAQDEQQRRQSHMRSPILTDVSIVGPTPSPALREAAAEMVSRLSSAEPQTPAHQRRPSASGVMAGVTQHGFAFSADESTSVAQIFGDTSAPTSPTSPYPPA